MKNFFFFITSMEYINAQNLTVEEAAMTTEDKAEAFIEGRYTAGSTGGMPGFDVIDYGQEDYVFGSSTQDARHWNSILLDIFEEHADTLSELFNAG